MVKNKGVIEKGAYTHYQPGSFVQVKNYIITRKGDKKYLLLKLQNSFDRTVDAIKLKLVQFDTAGAVISSESFTHNGLRMFAGGNLVINSPLVLDSACVDFRIQIVYAIAGEYKYFFRNGQAVQTYDPRGYLNRKDTYVKKSTLQATRKFENSAWMHLGIAWLASVAVLLTVLYATVGILF